MRARFGKGGMNMTFERKHIIATRVTREYSEVSSGFGPHDQGKGVRRQAGHGVWLANKTKKQDHIPLLLIHCLY